MLSIFTFWLALFFLSSLCIIYLLMPMTTTCVAMILNILYIYIYVYRNVPINSTRVFYVYSWDFVIIIIVYIYIYIVVTYPVTDIGRIATSIYFINIYKRYYSDIVRDKPSRDVIINSVFYNCPTAPASVREEGTTLRSIEYTYMLG